MILINNKEFNFESNLKLHEILSKLDIHTTKGIAIAVNNNIIPKINWGNFKINDNDKITIIKATQGG